MHLSSPRACPAYALSTFKAARKSQDFVDSQHGSSSRLERRVGVRCKRLLHGVKTYRYRGNRLLKQMRVRSHCVASFTLQLACAFDCLPALINVSFQSRSQVPVPVP